MSRAPSKKVRLGQFYTSTEVAEFMVRLADAPPKARVLEPGCGEGAFLEALLAGGYRDIVGYDVDPQNLRVIQQRFGDRIDARLASFLDAPREETFDLVIGNPPYVQWNNIDPEIREKLRSDPFWKELSNGEWDLLYAFIIWSVEKLRDGGELVFIVPYNWFNSTYAASLREYLLEHGSFEALIHFSEYKLFEDCAPNALIFKYRKDGGEGQGRLVPVAEFEGRRGETSELIADLDSHFPKLDPARPSELEVGEWRFFTSPHPRRGELWYLATPSEEQAVRAVEAATGGAVLEDDWTVAVGLVSGYDQAYLLSDEEYRKLTPAEQRLVHCFVKARSCQPYHLGHTARLVFPDEVETEDELEQLANLCDKLTDHRDKLLRRYGAQEKQWWRWATVRNLDVFRRHRRKPKIFVPCIDRSKVSRFCITERDVLGAGDVLCIVPRSSEIRESPYYLLGWLNSQPVRSWYRIKGSRTGHRTRYTQAYVRRMPLRRIDWDSAEEVERHDAIVEAVKRRLSLADPSEATKVEEQINELINGLLKN